MAKLYFKNKDYKMAEKSFTEYLNMNPEDETALKLLAQVYEQNKRYDKAFEMYERCYLAAPDRTGTLLDICRILLMNEIWLENVDYRKWLNLAIKAFPSNPIVVNYKAFLSTFPQDDQQTNSHVSDVDTKPTSAPLNDEPLRKILEIVSSINNKLDCFENKISAIETKMNQLSLASQEQPNKVPEKPFDIKPVKTNVVPDSKPVEITPAPEAKPIVTNSPAKNNWVFGQLTSAKVEPPKTLDTSLNFFKKTETPIESTWTFGQAIAEKVDKSPAQENKIANDTSTKKEQESPFSFFKKVDAPVENTWTFGQSLADKVDKNLTLENKTDNDSSTTNLFAASVKKFNLPTEGMWSFGGQAAKSKTEEQENNTDEKEDNEVVPNEELPIENTCEMKAIEIKTGEEDEDVLFEHRCKLYRFRDKEYKERGVGSIKVLKHKVTDSGRLIMRRDAIGLVCLNCWALSRIEKVKDTQIRFAGIDASDGDPEPTTFLVRFKTPQLTDEFLSHVQQFGQDLNSSLSSS